MLLTRFLALAAQGLLRRRVRTTFTLGAVIVGTVGLLLFLSVAYGLQQQLKAQLGSYEPATILHVDPPLSASSSSPAAGPPPALNDGSVQKLRTLPHVRDVFAEVQVGGSVTLSGASGPLELRPVPPSYLRAGADVHVLAGRLFTSNDARDLVVSSGFLQALGGGPPPGSAAASTGAGQASPTTASLSIATVVGRNVAFTAQRPDGSNGPTATFRVVGVIDGRAPFAYVPYNTGLSMLSPNPDGSSPSYDAAIVEVDDVEHVATVRQEITGLKLHIETADTLAKSLTDALNLARLIAAIIALLGLLLAVINITMMLLAAVTERAREIGIMKAVGARNRHIGALFLLESLLLGLAGSVIGSGLAILLAHVAALLIPVQMADGPPVTFAVPTRYAVVTIIMVTVLSGLAGLIPALRAAQMDPAAAIAGSR